MSTSIILKQDELGRVRVTLQRADELVAEYQRSGCRTKKLVGCGAPSASFSALFF
jgi:hypothetical protein